jgi:hypothetical protein
MTERERHVNQSLHALDEAHRLGRLSREEYRSRRRHLLVTLSESHVVTARNAIVRPAVQPQASAHAPPESDVLFPPRRAAWKWIVATIVVVVICAVLAYRLL